MLPKQITTQFRDTLGLLDQSLRDDFDRDAELVSGNGNWQDKKPKGTALQLMKVSRKTTPTPVQLSCVPDDAFEYSEEKSIFNDDIDKALEKITPDERRLLQMRYFDGMSSSVVAMEMGIPKAEYYKIRRIALLKLQHIICSSTVCKQCKYKMCSKPLNKSVN